MECIVCKTNLKEENPCDICGFSVCSTHSGSYDGMSLCDYCSGKDVSFHDRDLGDFAGTGG
ncbi:MAG TPA: hypothetical protein QF836_00170 [Nitrospinota bacterium]|jgi:hypothetical protein|nr:hypothetical protein [Nitrospinota bacterium]